MKPAAALFGTPEFNVLTFSFLLNLAWEVWQVPFTDAMPRLLVIGTGLLPLLQWLVIPPLVLWFVRRQIGARSPE